MIFFTAQERLNNELNDYFSKADAAENVNKDAAAKVEEEKKE